MRIGRLPRLTGDKPAFQIPDSLFQPVKARLAREIPWPGQKLTRRDFVLAS